MFGPLTDGQDVVPLWKQQAERQQVTSEQHARILVAALELSRAQDEPALKAAALMPSYLRAPAGLTKAEMRAISAASEKPVLVSA